MKIVILHFLDVKKQKNNVILNKLVESASKNGHQVDLVNGNLDAENFRITPYEYVTVVASGISSFSSKLSPQISSVIAKSGIASGKKACALVLKQLLFSQKLCKSLMYTMEKEGMVIDYFEVVASADHASYIGKKLG